jgi:ornithine carbamoyltransferase
MDVRIAAPESLWPDADLRTSAEKMAADSGARTLVTSDVGLAVADVDFLYTDVWVSMGEPTDTWGERIRKLLPYQVNQKVVALTGNADVRFMHCLPALHNRDTGLGEDLWERTGLSELEVTDDVFESSRSVVFDQAENRLHTIKAVMVATLGA